VSAEPFQTLEEALSSSGPEAAFDRLAEVLRSEKKYPQLFEALLMKKRHQLGLPLLGGDSIRDLPEALQAEVEEYYVETCRQVGSLYLEDGDLVSAWPYFRAIDEPARVAGAIQAWRVPDAGQGSDPEERGRMTDAIIDIALHQGAHPRRGFEIVLSEHGVCRAITVFEHQFPYTAEVREECGRMLVDRLHDDLRRSIANDIEHREGTAPAGADLRELMEGRPWLFEGHGYHVDVSHLQSVIRIAALLQGKPWIEKAVQMCEYGRRLPRDFQHPDRPPFTEFYSDYRIFLQALLGTGVDGAVRYFTQKVESQGAGDEARRFPAEVLVYLLHRTGRSAEAIAAHLKYLKGARTDGSVAPTLLQLCDTAGDYSRLLESARERGDLLQFTAGLVRAAGQRTAD
jgi:hypothetical protein